MIKAREYTRTVIAQRITQPEYKTKGDKVILILGCISEGKQMRFRAPKDIFLYAAGNDEDGFALDGLDRLTNHQYRIYLEKDEGEDGEERVVGLDIVGSRNYKSQVIPTHQEGVDTIKLVYELGGKICRMLQRPYNARAEVTYKVIDSINATLKKGQISEVTKLGAVGRVVSVTGNVIEVRTSASRAATSNGNARMTAEEMAAEAD